MFNLLRGRRGAVGASWADAESGPASTRRGFAAAYAAGTPGWDIGRPKPAFEQPADTGRMVGHVLDVGCGTGEHALLAAARGLQATGIDLAATAIAIATRKAKQRALGARFLTADALKLARLGTSFGTVLDCGLFHVLSDLDGPTFAGSLQGCSPVGARYHMLCFSDLEPGDWGPRRIRQEEIRRCFTQGWQIETIEPAGIDLTIEPWRAHAWLATIKRA